MTTKDSIDEAYENFCRAVVAVDHYRLLAAHRFAVLKARGGGEDVEEFRTEVAGFTNPMDFANWDAGSLRDYIAGFDAVIGAFQELLSGLSAAEHPSEVYDHRVRILQSAAVGYGQAALGLSFADKCATATATELFGRAGASAEDLEAAKLLEEAAGEARIACVHALGRASDVLRALRGEES